MKSPTALDLPMIEPLPKATKSYFDLCKEKLGMIPNVLTAHAFDIEKLDAPFTPEGGAYGHGRTHSHAHGPSVDHEHAKNRAHSHGHGNHHQ